MQEKPKVNQTESSSLAEQWNYKMEKILHILMCSPEVLPIIVRRDIIYMNLVTFLKCNQNIHINFQNGSTFF